MNLVFKSLVTFIFLISSLPSFSQSKEDNYISEIDILDKNMDSCLVFLSGENHLYSKTNNKIKLNLLNYLHDKHGFNHLIIELGYSRGYMLDQYINNDTTFYELLKSNTADVYLNFYKDLRKLNQTYPDSARIRVSGIDVERFPDDGFLLLKRLLETKKEIPDSLVFIVENIRAFASYFMNTRIVNYDDDNYSYSSRKFYNSKTIDSLINEFDAVRASFESLMGSDFALFDKVFQTLKDHRKYERYSSMPHQYVFRETYMFNNLKSLIQSNPKSKFYGQFGRCHISQTELNKECDWWGFNSLAKRIGDKLPETKIISVGIFYENQAKYSYFGKKETNLELEKYFSLTQVEESRLIKIKEKDTFLLKHYQFVIVAKNSGFGTKVVSSKDKEYLNLGFGSSFYNFNNLNQVILGNSFNNSLNQIHIGFDNYSDRFKYGYFIETILRSKIKATEADYRMGGSKLSLYLGYNLIQKRRFSVSLSGLLSYQRLSLVVEKNPMFSNPPLNGFNNVDVVKFFNPALLFGSELDVRHDIGQHFCVFLKAQNDWDFSRKQWYQSVGNGSKFLKFSPSTSLGNYSFKLGVGLKL
jgi:hypothetical protein